MAPRSAGNARSRIRQLLVIRWCRPTAFPRAFDGTRSPRPAPLHGRIQRCPAFESRCGVAAALNSVRVLKERPSLRRCNLPNGQFKRLMFISCLLRALKRQADPWSFGGGGGYYGGGAGRSERERLIGRGREGGLLGLRRHLEVSWLNWLSLGQCTLLRIGLRDLPGLLRWSPHRIL